MIRNVIFHLVMYIVFFFTDIYITVLVDIHLKTKTNSDKHPVEL